MTNDPSKPLRAGIRAPIKAPSRIYTFLAEGRNHSETARLLKIDESTVRKYAKKYVSAGLLAQTAKRPNYYRATGGIRAPISGVGDSDSEHPPFTIPHKFGASFALIMPPGLKRLPLHYSDRGLAKVEEPDHIVRFGRVKASIWLKAYMTDSEGTPDGFLKNGERALIEIAKSYERRFGITLTWLRRYEDVEWVKVSKEASAAQAAREGIAVGEQKAVADALHKLEAPGSSHAGHMEYNALPGGDKEAPTNHARADHYVYGGGLTRDLKKIGETLDKLADGQVAIRQRMDLKDKVR